MGADQDNPTAGPQRDVLAAGLGAYAAELPRGRQRRELTQLAADLRSGAAGDAFAQQGRGLAAAWVPRFAAAAATGRPLEPLAELFVETQSGARLWRRRLVAGAYVLLIALGALAAATFLGLAVTPIFGEIYGDFGLDLPPLTQVVVKWSRFISGDWGPIVGVALAVIVPCGALWWCVRRGWGTPLVGRFLSGSTGSVADAAALVQRIVDLREAGQSLPAAVAAAGSGCRNAPLRRGALAWGALRGAAVVAPRHYVRSLPATLVHLLDDETISPVAQLAMLKALAAGYRERVERRGSEALGMFAPIAIAFVGLFVLVVVLALFLPLVTLVGGLTG
ncbi:MAG: type II secretion system F family protein [Pirellulales bacterium]|nr:type II secretion system F family protein [Pirellulales bacterium]